MRTMRWLVPAAALAASLSARDALSQGQPDWTQHMGGLPFVVGLERGREEAKFTGRPQMWFFTSQTDTACPWFADRSFKDPDVLSKLAGYTPVLLDFDATDAALRTKYGAECVPSVIWLDHDEKRLYLCVGDAPLAAFRSEAEIARKRCPAPREPAEGWKALLELRAKLDAAAQAKDVRAQLAAVAEIRKVRLGEPVQAAARAADERLTKEGLAEVARHKAVLEDKKAKPAARAEAKKALERLVADYGAPHAVAAAAQEALDRASGKPKAK